MFEVLWIFLAYLLGSIPFGLIIAKHYCGIDLRMAGSKNVGATNVARLCGKRFGLAALACDVLKGTIPVLIAQAVNSNAVFITFVAIAVVLGHLFSCFLHFKGGKAVSTTIGVFIPLAIFPLILSAIICLVVIWKGKFVSLGSLCLVVSLPIFLFLFGIWKFIILSLILMSLVIWSHRDNIQRLACRNEKAW